MFLSQALGWLCEPPRSNFTLRGILQKGWPEVAGFIAMPKPLELGRLARLVERGIFAAGLLADIIWYEGTPLGILGTSHGLADFLELLVMIKIVAVLVGLAVQVSLKVIAYVIGGFEKLIPRRSKRIDWELYGPRKDD